MTATDRPISLSQFLIEVVAHACKAISIAVGKGALGRGLLATRYHIEAAQVPA